MSSISAVPCNRCEGPCTEFIIPSDIWNRVIRTEGAERDDEYICEDCWYLALREALQSGVIMFEMDDLDRELMAKARKAMECHDNGDPIKDVLDEDDIPHVLALLISIVECGGVIE